MNLKSKSPSVIAARIYPALRCNETPYHKTCIFRAQQAQVATLHGARLQSTIAAPKYPASSSNNTILSHDPSIGLGRSAPKSTNHERDTEKWLPASCPGCGALTQSLHSTEGGYYSKSRKAVKAYLQGASSSSIPREGNYGESILSSSEITHKAPEVAVPGSEPKQDEIHPAAAPKQLETPICDRCHDLLYNNKGQSIAHPTIEALTDSIAESPFKRNHVYHVLDAVDFPMSLIPKIFQSLELAKPRSQNRRARTKITSKSTVSFIITRSDLLGPTKDTVDRLMPYFQQVLRSALGRYGRDIRLGNVHLVSAKRGWWTKEIKDSIWERGGGNWMVGKVNVGKSNLFPVLFPKGSGDRAPIYADIQNAGQNEEDEARLPNDDVLLKEDSLLPPPQLEVAFPSMPLVSHLPGTTASPIRLPFGNHKGELIDLPGLERGNLEEHVRPENKLDLVMKYRPNTKQYVVKPGQSLLLGGGLIRITPHLDFDDKSMTLLAYPFIPIEAHITSTEKALALESQDLGSGIKSILADGAGAMIHSSGIYELDTDVTRTRADALLRAGVPVDRLQFRVYASDILIEGVGWVELVCQVRRTKKNNKQPQTIDDTTSDFRPFYEQLPATETTELETPDFVLPRVEIFSPNGKHIGHRPTLGAWNLWQRYKSLRQGSTNHVRPRKSMKGVKKRNRLVSEGVKAPS